MKTLSILLLNLLSILSFSQTVFEKGYYIDNNDAKTECLINNMDWAKNPVHFEFKLVESDASGRMEINSVKEFGIYNVCRYIRADVMIDTSNTVLRPLNYLKDPEWGTRRVFLKVLIDGAAKLLYYQDGYLTRFFFNMNDEPVTQLIYRQYQMRKPDNSNFDGDPVVDDRRYRDQLWMKMQCPGLEKDDINYLDYSQSSLERFFKKYYECISSPYTEYNTKTNRDVINIRIRPGCTYSSLKINETYGSRGEILRSHDLGVHYTFRLGLDVEIVPPFVNNKFAFFIEPTYQYHKESESVQLKFIEVPFGIRYYLFLNKNLRVHVNALVIPKTIDLGSKLWSNEINPYIYYAFGGGLNYKKYTTEIRYYTEQDLLRSRGFFNTGYKKISFIIGYQLF